MIQLKLKWPAKHKLLAGLTALVTAFSMLPQMVCSAEMSALFEDAADTAAFTRLCDERLETIPAEMQRLVLMDAYTEWMRYHEAILKDTPDSLNGYPNLYSYIKTLDLSAESVTEALREAGTLTEEEIALVLSGDDAAILQHFALESSIVIDAHVYGIEWLYENDAEAYALAGITPELLTQKLDCYPSELYTAAAADALAEKFYQYTGKLTKLQENQWLAGDVNLDGSLTAQDIVRLQRNLLGTEKLSFKGFASSDVNNDGFVDVFDLAALKRLIPHDTVKVTEPVTEPLTEPITEPVTEPPTDPPTPDLPTEIMLNVMEFSQHPDYPTGCESAALYMLLHYYDVDVPMTSIVTVLPKGPLPYLQDGVLYGANPEREFVGDPRNSNSYGVFQIPMGQTAAVFKSGVQTQAGASLEEVISILNSGNPVMAWYTTNPDKEIVYRREWYDYKTGQLIQWPGGEHAVVICGHDQTTLTYRDPNTGGSRTMEIETFRKIYDELGGRILYYND